MPRRWPLRVIASLLVALLGTATFAQDVLPPQQVFRYTADADGRSVRLHFDILDGYYLYRERFAFESATPGVSLRAAEFPKGDIHKDEFFGEQEIYRGKFDISLPYERTASADGVKVALKLQGCADFGLCYPPQDWTADVKLPSAPAAATTLFDGGTPAAAASTGLLSPDQAFVMNARFDRPNELTVGWQISPGYYLYKDKLTFSVDGKIELGRVSLPAGKRHSDDNFGDVDVYYDYVEAVIPFSRPSPDAMNVVIKAGYQGCKEDSICYPPDQQTMDLVLPATSEFATTATATHRHARPRARLPYPSKINGPRASSRAPGGRCWAGSMSAGSRCR